MADRSEYPSCHGFGRSGHRDIGTIAAAIDIARRGRIGAAPRAFLDASRVLVDRSFWSERGKYRLEQREIDDLAARLVMLACAQRGHGRERSIKPRDHVGQRKWRKHRLAVGE